MFLILGCLNMYTPCSTADPLGPLNSTENACRLAVPPWLLTSVASTSFHFWVFLPPVVTVKVEFKCFAKS